MAQFEIWEKEYQDPRLVTGGTEPQNDFKRFIKWLKKEQKQSLEGLRVLDVGSGLGKNAIFLAERGAVVTGMEISDTAIKTARERANAAGVLAEPHKDAENTTTFIKHDIGKPYPLPNQNFDLIIDVISSNSLNEEGRKIYLGETHRVLKSGGYFFVRALCKEGDKNAEHLLTHNSGPEKDTYIMPGLNLTERVFSKEDFTNAYSPYFKILDLQKKSGYAQFAGKTYKRNYWLAYMLKE